MKKVQILHQRKQEKTNREILIKKGVVFRQRPFLFQINYTLILWLEYTNYPNSYISVFWIAALKLRFSSQ